MRKDAVSMSNQRDVYICPVCRTSWFSAVQCKCSKCGHDTARSACTEAQWKTMSDEEKSKVKEETLQKWNALSDAERVKLGHAAPAPVPSGNPADSASSSSGWISALRAFVYVVLVVGILGSLIAGLVILGDAPAVGLLIMIGGIIVSILSAAAVMVFLDMATDVRAIRQLLENEKK